MEVRVKPMVEFQAQTKFLNQNELKKLKNDLRTSGIPKKVLKNYLTITYKIINDLESMAAGHHLRDRRPRLQIANATYVGTVEFAKTVSDLVADSVLSAICDGRNAPKADDDMAEKLLKDVGEINIGGEMDRENPADPHAQNVRLGVANAIARILTAARVGVLPDVDRSNRRRIATNPANLARPDAGKTYDYCAARRRLQDDGQSKRRDRVTAFVNPKAAVPSRNVVAPKPNAAAGERGVRKPTADRINGLRPGARPLAETVTGSGKNAAETLPVGKASHRKPPTNEQNVNRGFRSSRPIVSRRRSFPANEYRTRAKRRSLTAADVTASGPVTIKPPSDRGNHLRGASGTATTAAEKRFTRPNKTDTTAVGRPAVARPAKRAERSGHESAVGKPLKRKPSADEQNTNERFRNSRPAVSRRRFFPANEYRTQAKRRSPTAADVTAAGPVTIKPPSDRGNDVRGASETATTAAEKRFTRPNKTDTTAVGRPAVARPAKRAEKSARESSAVGKPFKRKPSARNVTFEANGEKLTRERLKPDGVQRGVAVKPSEPPTGADARKEEEIRSTRPRTRYVRDEFRDRTPRSAAVNPDRTDAANGRRRGAESGKPRDRRVGGVRGDERKTAAAVENPGPGKRQRDERGTKNRRDVGGVQRRSKDDGSSSGPPDDRGPVENRKAGRDPSANLDDRESKPVDESERANVLQGEETVIRKSDLRTESTANKTAEEPPNDDRTASDGRRENAAGTNSDETPPRETEEDEGQPQVDGRSSSLQDVTNVDDDGQGETYEAEDPKNNTAPRECNTNGGGTHGTADGSKPVKKVPADGGGSETDVCKTSFSGFRRGAECEKRLYHAKRILSRFEVSPVTKSEYCGRQKNDESIKKQ